MAENHDVLHPVQGDIGNLRLRGPSPAGLHWTTSNFGEAMPGVQTPLSASVWGSSMEWASRRLLYEMGILTGQEYRGALPAPLESPMLRSFYGRMAYPIEFFTLIGDRVPGISGEEVVLGMLGVTVDDMVYRPTRRRYAAIAARFPYAFASIPRRLASAGRESEPWYQAAVRDAPNLDHAGAVAALAVATDRFKRAVMLQGLSRMAVIQPLYQALTDLVAATGSGDVGILSGTGGTETTGLVGDIWRASRDQLAVEVVRRRHGFHGPLEGELSSRLWREDEAPLRDLVERYAAEPDSSDPTVLGRERETRRQQLVRELLAAVPRHRRTQTRLTLHLAATRIPLLGAAKRTFLQSFDAARAAARRLGECLAIDGTLAEADDVFYLTVEECGSPPPDIRQLVESRREHRIRCFDYTVPAHWAGSLTLAPETVDTTAPSPDGGTIQVSGVGVSAGVAQGQARVVLEPDFADVEPGEILVAPFTDPGWAPIMYVSAALVVDIGGALSHAAVVARELGIPCVVNTQTGTRRIRTGDVIRVDGSTGAVDILEPVQLTNANSIDPEA